MKYLIVSDIHGSFESGKVILDKFNYHKCDKIIVLGDVLYHGPRNDLPSSYSPKKLTEILNSISDKIIAIKGNCDAEVDEMVLLFKFYPDKIISYNNEKILLTHGHHINPEHPSLRNDINIVLYGHTHIYDSRIVNNVIYLNPGSITIPKGGNPKSYAILDNNQFIVFDLFDNVLLKENIFK